MSEMPDFKEKRRKQIDMAMNMVMGATVAPEEKAAVALKGVVGNAARMIRASDKSKYAGKYASEVVDWAKRLRGRVK